MLTYIFFKIFTDKFAQLNMIHYMLLFSRQGKLRLQKWYVAYPDKVCF